MITEIDTVMHTLSAEKQSIIDDLKEVESRADDVSEKDDLWKKLHKQIEDRKSVPRAFVLLLLLLLRVS